MESSTPASPPRRSVPGRFIAFEGLDGSGKSTQLSLLARRLVDRGVPVLQTKEPTTGPVGSLIHQIMTGRIRSDQKTIAALFAADRLDHLLNPVDGLRERIEAGQTVLCDRYYFSSYAYHSAHVPMDWVIKANALSAEIQRPDLTVFVDVPPEVCLRRLSEGRWHLELYENLETMHRVRQQYLESFRLLHGDEKVVIVDGQPEAALVAESVWAFCREYF